MNTPAMRQDHRPTEVRRPISWSAVWTAFRAGTIGLVCLCGLGACARRHAEAAAAPVKKAAAAPSAIRRLAPDFITVGAGGHPIPSKQFRGQPVVILVAASPDSKPLRKEADRIEQLYLDFSARKAIFVGAFTAASGRVASNVPYIIAQNGTAVANAFGVAGSEFALIVIGVDGNVDLVITKVESAQRILDVINNNGSVQAANRTGLGS